MFQSGSLPLMVYHGLASDPPSTYRRLTSPAAAPPLPPAAGLAILPSPSLPSRALQPPPGTPPPAPTPDAKQDRAQIFIPVSRAMIGSNSKQREPPHDHCYECGVTGQHSDYAYECTRRSIRVLGYASPGFGSDGLREPAR